MAVPEYTFEDLIDLIGGPVEAWPRQILEAYQKPVYKAGDRLKLCLFNYVNGFDNRIFLEFAHARGALIDRKAYEDVEHLTAVLEEGTRNLNKWFSFNLEQNRWLYLNGNTKHY